jgi:hypothetical protein
LIDDDDDCRTAMTTSRRAHESTVAVPVTWHIILQIYFVLVCENGGRCSFESRCIVSILFHLPAAIPRPIVFIYGIVVTQPNNRRSLNSHVHRSIAQQQRALLDRTLAELNGFFFFCFSLK